MRLKCLFVLLMVGLMASVGFGGTENVFCGWDGTNSKWDDTDGQNWQDELGNTIPKPDGTREIRAFGGTNEAYPLGGTITLDSHEDWADIYSNRVRIYGGVTLNIVPNIQEGVDITSLIGPGFFRVGQILAVGHSVVNQSGGLLMLKGTVAQGGKDPTRLVMGDSQNPGNDTSGTYNMSGGTLTHTNVGTATGSEGSIVIGDRGGTGTFIVQGTAPVINMGRLYVGGNSGLTSGNRHATGTLAFDVKAAGVSAVNVTDVVALDTYGALSTAALIVTVTEALTEQFAPIVLVRNTGTTAVSGRFDTFNGVDAIEGAMGWCQAAGWRQLTYLYCADGDSINNDIALLIPEPAAIALLSIGLFAIRRKN